MFMFPRWRLPRKHGECLFLVGCHPKQTAGQNVPGMIIPKKKIFRYPALSSQRTATCGGSAVTRTQTESNDIASTQKERASQSCRLKTQMKLPKAPEPWVHCPPYSGLHWPPMDAGGAWVSPSPLMTCSPVTSSDLLV